MYPFVGVEEYSSGGVSVMIEVIATVLVMGSGITEVVDEVIPVVDVVRPVEDEVRSVEEAASPVKSIEVTPMVFNSESALVVSLKV